MFCWPPKSGKICEDQEVTLITKTIESKYLELEKEATKIHSSDTPCIITVPAKHVSQKYYKWIKGELS